MSEDSLPLLSSVGLTALFPVWNQARFPSSRPSECSNGLSRAGWFKTQGKGRQITRTPSHTPQKKDQPFQGYFLVKGGETGFHRTEGKWLLNIWLLLWRIEGRGKIITSQTETGLLGEHVDYLSYLGFPWQISSSFSHLVTWKYWPTRKMHF